MKSMNILYAVVIFLLISTLTYAAPKVKVLTADPGYPPEENELSMCSLGCAMGWHTKASSSLEAQGVNNYDVDNIDDYRVKTVWVEGAKGYGIGETITYTFTKEDFDKAKIGNKINFNGFLVLNGYCKNKKVWRENSRVKRIRISHNKDAIYEAILHDSMNLQEIAFDNVYLKPEDTVTVTILDVYPGTKFQDTAISELIPTGAH